MSQAEIEALAKSLLQTPVILSIVGGVISLCTSYIPRFREWYAALQPEQKALGQLLIITAIVILCGVVSWTGLIAVVPQGVPGYFVLGLSWIAAVQFNQTAYNLSKPAPSVILIKEQMKAEVLAEAKAEVNAEKAEVVKEARDDLKEALK